MLRMVVGLVLCLVVATRTNAVTPRSSVSVERFEATFVSALPDGQWRRETRPLRAGEIEAMGDAHANEVEDGAPGRPPPPHDSEPGDLLRINYHRLLNGWTRDTSYARIRGGPWLLLSDRLYRSCDASGNDAGGGCADPK